jgi:tetratricopeptide (TPR) repeat protein
MESGAVGLMREAGWLRAAALVLLLNACTTTLKPRSGAPAPAADQPQSPATVADLAAAVAADSRRSDATGDAKIREQLAEDAESNAEACLQLDPKAAACLYYHAVALGLEARAHPLRANDLLKSMLDSLSAAQAADPGYDEAGPDRVKALVLARAPGWPLGPGDPDAALSAARRAVQLQPQYPPNLLALAEALSKTGDAAGARVNYQRARDLAEAAPASADRADWLEQADRALKTNP